MAVEYNLGRVVGAGIAKGGAPGQVLKKSGGADYDTIWADESRVWSNPNLLHNWDFRNPVNQRGQTSYARPSADYTIDRWRIANDGTVAIVAGGITLTKDLQLEQIFEKADWNGKLMTVSIMIAGIIYAGSFTWNASAGFTSALVIPKAGNTLGYTLGYTGTSKRIWIRPSPGDGGDLIQCVKLEMGGVSTLANDPPADYADELRKCQRYQLVFAAGVQCGYVGTHGTNGYGFIPTPVTMRINPAVTSANGFSIIGGTNVTEVTPTGWQAFPGGVRVTVTLAAQNLYGGAFAPGIPSGMIMDANL